MRIAVFDGWSGVAGDMWVGALLDAGVPLAPLQAAVASLALPGVTIRAERLLRGGLAGTHFRVDVGGAEAPLFAPVAPSLRLPLVAGPGHVHRRLSDIEAIVQRAELPAAVVADCLRVYRAIGEVEAKAHGCSLADVHFHEVGAEDTIVDVVCACLGTHLLGVDRLLARGIQTGTGTVQTEHGLLPVPAPATAALLHGIPVRSSLPGERTTPTGAALLRVLCQGFDEAVAFTSEAIGYGAGTKDFDDVPNLLRVTIGSAMVRAPGALTELVELQCQLDTATGEQLGWLLDEALQRGAQDAFASPVTMKKGRPGVLLTVLVDAARASALETLLLEESSTLGVRRHVVQRSVLERWSETRTTALGAVVFKVARLPSGVVTARPEDDELRRLCKELGLGRAEVLRRLLG